MEKFCKNKTLISNFHLIQIRNQLIFSDAMISTFHFNMTNLLFKHDYSL